MRNTTLRGGERRSKRNQRPVEAADILRQACRDIGPVLNPGSMEQLEKRLMMTITQTDPNLVAFEAETPDAVISAPGADNSQWFRIDGTGANGSTTAPSGGAALMASRPVLPDAGNRASGSVTYPIDFTSPGDYFLYVRDKFMSGSDNSMWAPPHDGPINGDPANTTNNPNPFDNHNGATERFTNYNWFGADSADVAFKYTVAAAGPTTLTFKIREGGFFIDRVVLSKTELTPDDLNAMMPQTVRAAPALYPDLAGVTLTYDAVPTATAYNILHSTSASGPFTAVTGGTGVTDTTFTDDSIPASNTGRNMYYVVEAVTPTGNVRSSPVLYVAGSGLIATHYETRFFQDNPDSDNDPIIRTDNTLDQNWGSDGPSFLEADPSSTDPDDTWSVIFNGRIRAQNAGDYTFYTASDDGIDIQIVDPDTGNVVLAGPNGGIDFLRGIGYQYQDVVGTTTLQANKFYNLRVRWSENGGGAAWRVAWSGPSTPFQVIPNDVLFRPDTSVVPLSPTNLVARPRSDGAFLTWTDRANNETDYLVERKVGAGAFQQIADLPPDTTSYTDSDATLAAGTLVTYRVRAKNAAGNSAYSNEATATVGGGGGNGLLGTVYETRFFELNPDSTDADPHIDHDLNMDMNWGGGGPSYLEADASAADPNDTWSVAFTGQVLPEFSEPYTFYTASDDGIELTLIDPATGQIILNGPPNGIQLLRGIGYPYQDNVGTVNLTAGKKYDMQVRWSENGGGAAWRVAWSSPSVPFEVIPDLQLFEATGNETVRPAQNLNATVICSDRITVTWVDASLSETGSVLQKADSAAGPWTDIATLGPNQNTSLTDNGPFTVDTNYYYRVVTNGPGGPATSQVLTAHTYNGGALTDPSLQLNGTATFITVPATVDDDTQALRLTDNVNSQSGTAFIKQALNFDRDWTTTFDWYIPERSGSRADGFTFMVQAASPTAVGGGGGSLAAQGIPNSLAVKFDIYPNLQNQTGIYVNGEGMADDGTDIGFDIANGHRYHATITFDANPTEGDPNDALTLKIEDVTDPTVTPFEMTFTTTHDNATPFDIAALLGSGCGWVGFTGATGGENAEQDMLDWTFDGVNIPFGPQGPTNVHVTQVFANGQGLTGQTSANGQAFRAMAGIDNTFGYPIPTGANQLKTLPWVNGINAVSLRFDADVSANLGQGDLVVRGVNTPTYTITGFSYDAGTKTGTWTLSTPITNDKVRLFLDDALLPGLDGEWADSTDTFPSGNGTAGGDFAFRFNVLRGDATQDGRVNALDLSYIKQRLNKTATNPGTVAPYTPFADLTADGSINALDLSAARARLNNALPTGEPATALLFSTRAISR